MYTQVFQDLEFCDGQIHALMSDVKVHEEKESILKFRFQGISRSREDESHKKFLEKKLSDYQILIMHKSNKFKDAWSDRTLEFKNEKWYAKRF